MTKLEQFYFDNAGSSYDPKVETEEQGKARGAADLAKAAHYALDQGWTFEWDTDPDGHSCDEDHSVEYCQLWDGETLLGSLSEICGATDDYRRVVEAELALEAMHAREAK